MSLGTLVLGLLNGLTVGLLAVGLVLVYKSNRFLNMAHAQMGALSALLLAKFVLDWRWNFWLCFFLTVATGTGVGLVVERLFGRLRRQGGSTVRLLLLSVAVSEVLLGLTFVPALGPNQSKAAMYPQPFQSHLRIGHVVLSGMSVLTAVLVPVIVLGLAAFLRYSVLGKGIRAAANNPDAARLCGISVARVSAVTWAMAGSLSAVSAILEAPNQPSFDISAFGPYLLMLTLGAAAFGAFVSLPAALVGGLVLGLVGQIVSGETSNGADGEVAVFAVILIVILLRGREIGRVFALTSGASDSRPLLRVPQLLRTSPLVRYQRTWLGAAGLFAATVLPNLPYFRTEGHRFLLALVLVYALIGVGLTMLVGWAGQVSLGHFALVGFGAYLAARWGPHWSLPAIMVVAGIMGAGVMIVVGLPALRVGGLALAVTTMGFAVICADWLYRQGWFGSSQPFVNVRPIATGPDLGTAGSKLAIYYVALVVLTLGVASASALRRWGPGRLVIAVRDNEQAVQAFGMNPATIKLAILAVSGFYAAVAGVLWGDAWGVVSPQQFTADLSISIVAIPVVGGLGSLSGAVAAAALLYMGTFFLGPELSGVFGSYGHNVGFQLFLAGFSQIGVLLSYPTGLAGFVQQKWQRYLERRAEVMEKWSTPEVTPLPGGMSASVTSGDASPPIPSEGRIEHLADIVKPRETTAGGTAGALPLATEGVTVRFGGLTALNGPDIEVRPGEVVGLIGPNGAGKTTLMNVISGVLRADAGSVRLFGREVADLPPDFRAAFGLARTFQDARLFGGLSVLETIQVAMAYRHKVGMGSAMVAAPWAQAREVRSQDDAERILARFGLQPWREALTSELSTGTRRICELAAQVAAAPKILLLDEPTAGVAQREAEAFGPLLRRIRDELDCSVLIVEHDMPLLMALCDRVYAMEAGAVIAEGTPEEIRNDPAVVASYLGSRESAVRRSGSTTVPTKPPGARRGAGRKDLAQVGGGRIGADQPSGNRSGGSASAADTTEMPVPVTTSRSRGSRSKS